MRHTRSVYPLKNDKSMTDSTESLGELSTVQIRSLEVLEKCSNYQVKITVAPHWVYGKNLVSLKIALVI